MANQSIQRATAILSLFSLARPQMKVAQIAKELALPVPTVHGLVRTLVDEGLMAQHSETREYRLGIRLNTLGSIQMATLDINQRAALPATYLARDTGLFAHVAVFERDTMVVTYSTSPLMIGGRVGPYLGLQFPTYCSSIGRAVLSHLPRKETLAHLSRLKLVSYTRNTITDHAKILNELDAARERGFAIVKRELDKNLTSLGAPLFRENGTVWGGISINDDKSRIQPEDFDELGSKLLDTAANISKNGPAYNEPQFHAQQR